MVHHFFMSGPLDGPATVINRCLLTGSFDRVGDARVAMQEGFPVKRMRGFSLIELMVVVAIVAILAAIAYPSYQDQVRKSRRAEATGTLSQAAQGLERCYTRFNAYNNAACTTFASLTGAGITSEDGWYIVTGAFPDGQTFTLTAAPQNAQVSDTDCDDFWLSNTGQRGVTGGHSANPELCW